MDKHLRQTFQELTRFLQQNHITLDELYTLFPNQSFAIQKKQPVGLEPFYREDIPLEYLPDPNSAQTCSEIFDASNLAQLLQEKTEPFSLYCFIREVSPLFSGVYRYRESERALELLSEPSSKLLEKFPVLLQAPLTLFFALSPLHAERWRGSRFLLPAMVQLGQILEKWSTRIPLKIYYEFDGHELLKRLELSAPVLALISILPKKGLDL